MTNESPDVSVPFVQTESDAPAEPARPPFMVGHLDLNEVLAVIRLLHPWTAGKPNTPEVMASILYGNPPEGLPEGLTPDLAVQCFSWAIDIRRQHQQERANHMRSGATIGYAKHLVESRFKIVRKRLKKAKQAKRGRGAGRKKSEARR